MAVKSGLFSLVQPTKVKGDASSIDDTQTSMLESLASGDISGSLSSGDKLIALGALLKSVSRGSKTTPQEVMQNLQASKLQEMQNKIQLQQLRAERDRKARLKPIVERAAGIGPAGASGQPLMPEDLFALSAQALAEGDPELAKSLREQAAGIAQYTGAGALVSAFAQTTGKSPYEMLNRVRPDGTPYQITRWEDAGASSPGEWVMRQLQQFSGAGAPAPMGAGAPTSGGAGSIPVQVNGTTVNVPPMSPPVKNLGGDRGAPSPAQNRGGDTGLNPSALARIQVDADVFKDLKMSASKSAQIAQQRLPQIQALGMLSDALATGKTAEFRYGVQAYLDAFGLSDSPQAKMALSNAAAFANLRKQETVNRMSGLTGAPSDKDAEIVAGIGPLMKNTRQGNRLITATETALARRDIAFNNFLGRYRGEPGMALEAWSKTKAGRLGILADPVYVTEAAKTGLLRKGTVKDTSGRLRHFVVPVGRPVEQAIFLD